VTLGGRDLRPFGAGSIIVLLAVAAAGSGALRNHGQPTREHTGLALLLAFFAIVPAAAITIAAFLQALTKRNFGGGNDDRNPWTLKAQLLAVGTLLLVLAAAFIVLVAAGDGTKHPETKPPLVHRDATQSIGDFTATTLPAKSPASSPNIQWWMAVSSVILIGAMGAGMVALNKGRHWGATAEPEPPSVSDAAIAQQAVEASIEALTGEIDARQGVIAAYVSMERILALTGLPRFPSETPFEYVDRILVRFGASVTTAYDVAALFEEAKFSSHPVGEDKRISALDALNALRHELHAESH